MWTTGNCYLKFLYEKCETIKLELSDKICLWSYDLIMEFITISISFVHSEELTNLCSWGFKAPTVSSCLFQFIN